MAEPLLLGAAQVTSAEAFRPSAAIELGASGKVYGVAVRVVDVVPVPTALSARNATVYDVPLASPEMVIGLLVVPAETHDPLLSWYSYPVMAELPALPAVKARASVVLPGVREFSVGAPGGATGVTATRGADAAPEPAAFAATTET